MVVLHVQLHDENLTKEASCNFTNFIWIGNWRDQSTSKTEAHWNEQHLIKILHIKRVEID